MTLILTDEEVALLRFACNEMANRRAEQSHDAGLNMSAKERRDLNEMYRRAAVEYRALALKLTAAKGERQ